MKLFHRHKWRVVSAAAATNPRGWLVTTVVQECRGCGALNAVTISEPHAESLPQQGGGGDA